MPFLHFHSFIQKHIVVNCGAVLLLSCNFLLSLCHGKKSFFLNFLINITTKQYISITLRIHWCRSIFGVRCVTQLHSETITEGLAGLLKCNVLARMLVNRSYKSKQTHVLLVYWNQLLHKYKLYVQVLWNIKVINTNIT